MRAIVGPIAWACGEAWFAAVAVIALAAMLFNPWGA